MEVVQAYVGVRETYLGEAYIEVCSITAKMLYLAPLIVGEVVLEILYQLSLLPVGDDVEKFACFSIGEVCDEFDPLRLFSKVFLNFGECLI